MIDLHLHTTASDGILTPAELLKKCEKAGLSLISISDHFTMDGYEDLKKPEIRQLFSGEVLPACEFSAHFRGISIEILGYGIDPDAATPFIRATYPPLKEKQRLELEHLIVCYRERGYTFDEKQVRSELPANRNVIWRELMRYPENREKLTDPRAAESMGVFLRRELGNPESPFFRPMNGYAPEAAEICRFIQSLGGKAIVAHPGIYHPIVYNTIEDLIREAKPDGLEAWYILHTSEQREHLLSLCQKYNLIYSGGSDYHNQERELNPGNTLGMPSLEKIFPVSEIRAWADTLKKI